MHALILRLLVMGLVLLISGCASGLPKPVLPDGSHRVPINRVSPVLTSPDSVEPDPATVPDASASGGGATGGGR
ncbi:hypothetical protein LMG9964_02408 [Paraburkholderia phenoliruptrix]|uniref:Lipoprotein n=1 Tax=Paraburkholderia phenoliruptrix TaxID=252970 RepID=A0A6J5K4X6_9BURK|nr:hypothetical protein LMG9964_02408 [Paraburkholderia phenoliruptrix]